MRISDWSSDVCSSDLVFVESRLDHQDVRRETAFAHGADLAHGPISLMPDFTHEGPSRLAEGVDRALPDDAQAVTLEAHDGAPGVRQQDHVANAEIQQDPRADGVVAQLADGLGLAVAARLPRYRKGIGRGLADKTEQMRTRLK